MESLLSLTGEDAELGAVLFPKGALPPESTTEYQPKSLQAGDKTVPDAPARLLSCFLGNLHQQPSLGTDIESQQFRQTRLNLANGAHNKHITT